MATTINGDTGIDKLQDGTTVSGTGAHTTIVEPPTKLQPALSSVLMLLLLPVMFHWPKSHLQLTGLDLEDRLQLRTGLERCFSVQQHTGLDLVGLHLLQTGPSPSMIGFAAHHQHPTGSSHTPTSSLLQHFWGLLRRGNVLECLVSW